MADQQKKDAAKAARKEEKKMADEAIDKLKSEHEDVIIKAGDQGWDKATNPAADQICGLKDIIL